MCSLPTFFFTLRMCKQIFVAPPLLSHPAATKNELEEYHILVYSIFEVITYFMSAKSAVTHNEVGDGALFSPVWRR